MLTPSERRVLIVLVCWLAAGAVLDAVLAHRPRLLVPWLGPERAAQVALAGAADLEADAAPSTVAPASTRKGAGPKPRGRAFVYDAQGRLDLNLADSTELVLLPGVGPALAGRILEARTRRGRFRDAKDLLDVRGIGEKTLAKLLPKIAVRADQDSLAIRPPSR
jgi:competence protein ComEA